LPSWRHRRRSLILVAAARSRYPPTPVARRGAGHNAAARGRPGTPHGSPDSLCGRGRCGAGVARLECVPGTRNGEEMPKNKQKAEPGSLPAGSRGRWATLTAYRREPVRAGAAPGRRTNAAEFPVDRRAGCPPRGPKDSRAPLADAAKVGANWPTGSARGTPGRRRQPGRKPHPTVDGGRRLSRTRAHCAPMAGPLPGRRDVADTVSTRAERAIEGRRKKLRTEGGVPTVERPRAFEGSHCGAPGVGPAPGREVPQDKRHTALHNDPFSQRLSASRRTGRKRWAAAAAAEDGRCRK
jgi:hypothetical protein